MAKFIFDVDGTLTLSRTNIDGEFQGYFLDFCFANDVYLVTGSDYPKTVEQLSVDICEAARRVYNCSGNDIWEAGVNIYTNDWKLSSNAEEWLVEKLNASAFPLRTGIHLEHRPGMCNFSVVGRGATKEQRKQYVDYDSSTNERTIISKEFNSTFPDLCAKVGGETGIDIFPKGKDKGQIIKEFDSNDELYFFGDRCDPDGNDFPLAKQIANTYHVKNWRDTFNILRKLQNTGVAL